MHDIFDAIKEVGIGAAGVIAVVWIAVYLVKKFVDVSCTHLAQLVTSLKYFMDKVRDEHKQSSDEHKAIMEQHREMISTLGRINGYKQRDSEG